MRARKTHWLALVFLVGVVADGHATVTGTITQLSTGSASELQTQPQISGNSVVWTDIFTANGNTDIFYLDLASTLPARNVTNTSTEQEFLEDVDATNLIWTHTSPLALGDIVVYDVTTSRSRTIAPSNSSLHFEQPAIQGRYAVYLRANSQFDVDGYDLTLGLPFAAAVTDDAAMQARPRIYGDTIVYEDYGSGSADIHGYRISSAGPAFAIATGASSQTFPDIDARHVVWVDDAGGTDTIHLYDLQSGAQQAITSVASHKIQPRVSGSYVVWADDRNAGQGFDVYIYDMTTGREEMLVGGAGDQVLADIDGTRIVYTSNANGFDQVDLFTMTDPPPPPPPSVPFGCDPAHTDPVGSAVTMSRASRLPAFATASFATQPGKDYFVCVENGKPTGEQRTAHFLFGADGRIALTPNDFRPQTDPPHYVSTKLQLGGFCLGGGDLGGGSHHGGCTHVWTAAMFGPEVPATATVQIRVAR